MHPPFFFSTGKDCYVFQYFCYTTLVGFSNQTLLIATLPISHFERKKMMLAGETKNPLCGRTGGKGKNKETIQKRLFAFVYGCNNHKSTENTKAHGRSAA